LLGQESPYAPVHHLIVAYERGDWDTFASLAADFPDGEHALPAIFAQSVQWATQAMASLDG